MTQKIIEKILKARVYDVAEETPLEHAPLLSKRLGNYVLLKREDQQPVFSFKLRGAYNKIFSLTKAQKARGVVTASAGNHAQGVALAGKKLAVSTHIVMPGTTPPIKVNAVRALGGKAILHGDTYDEAYAHAMSLSKKEKMAFIHPFDDLDVIAGQGTIGMELLRQHPDDIDVVFIPVGGGGLIAGVATYLKYLYPKIKVIGVEAEDAPSMHDSLKAGRRVTLKQVGLFADGAAVKKVGKETFSLARKVVDDVVLVKTDEICAAIKDIFEDTRTMPEPAGALAVAGMKKYIFAKKQKNKTMISIVSGANINFDRLRHVAERAEVGESREALLAVTIPEEPGSFLKFCRLLGRRGITEFNYRYADHRDAQVYAGVKLANGDADRRDIIKILRSKKYQVKDLTDNEVAKVHLRFMVGGHAPGVEEEVIVRFQFPERPGALLNFLAAMGQRWNISLFHYRNHGAAYGRVLVGVQVPPKERKAFWQSLDKLGYQYWDESGNPACEIFLG